MPESGHQLLWEGSERLNSSGLKASHDLSGTRLMRCSKLQKSLRDLDEPEGLAFVFIILMKPMLAVERCVVCDPP